MWHLVEVRSPRIAWALGVLALVPLGASRAAAAPPSTEQRAFDEAMETIAERALDGESPAEIYDRSLKAVVATLDEHGHYLSPKERKWAAKRLKAGGGMGMHARYARRGGKSAMVVTSVRGDGPSKRAGLLAGDRIVAIDGKRVDEMASRIHVQASMAGKPGRKVRLTVNRPEDPSYRTVVVELENERARADVAGSLLRPNAPAPVAYVRVWAFRSGTGKRVSQELSALRRRAGGHLGGCVLDLRDNPGGEVEEALIVAELFVSKGVLTRIEGREGKVLREEVAHEPGTLSLPLVVIVDRHSASASELLSAALQDHEVAQVIGTHTYGKGSVQEVHGLPDGGVLSVTIGRYVSPKGRVIDKVGLEPDQRLELAQMDDEAVIAAALAAL